MKRLDKVWAESRGYGRKWRWNPWRRWEWNNEGGCPLSNWLTMLILRSFRHMWMKNCLNHWKQISKHIFQFLFFPFFGFWTNLSARQYDFHELNFLKGTDNQSWICVGFIMLVSWSRLRVWKQMWIVKTQREVMVFCNNVLWIMLHHKFICLLCVHHFFFLFLLDVTKSSSSFFLSFSNFLILMDLFIGEPSVKQKCKPSMWGDPFQGNLKEKYLLL